MFPTKSLPDGRTLTVMPLFYGARLGVSPAGDTTWFDDVW